jgi:hypothetical protein
LAGVEKHKSQTKIQEEKKEREDQRLSLQQDGSMARMVNLE